MTKEERLDLYKIIVQVGDLSDKIGEKLTQDKATLEDKVNFNKLSTIYLELQGIYFDSVRSVINEK